eukprot:9470180-Pyramimonas_sp.AAC.1
MLKRIISMLKWIISMLKQIISMFKRNHKHAQAGSGGVCISFESARSVNVRGVRLRPQLESCGRGGLEGV